jgi:hypothetical protein
MENHSFVTTSTSASNLSNNHNNIMNVNSAYNYNLALPLFRSGCNSTNNSATHLNRLTSSRSLAAISYYNQNNNVSTSSNSNSNSNKWYKPKQLERPKSQAALNVNTQNESKTFKCKLFLLLLNQCD